MILSKTRSRSLIPKPPKPKFLKRSRKPIQRKSRFKSNDDKTKVYHTKRIPADVIRFAEACRMERLADPTVAEDAFAELLRKLGVGYERERIYFIGSGGNRFVIADFFLPGCNTIVEIDGLSHKAQIEYDICRDAYFRNLGIRTIRFENKIVFKNQEAVKAKIREIMGDKI